MELLITRYQILKKIFAASEDFLIFLSLEFDVSLAARQPILSLRRNTASYALKYQPKCVIIPASFSGRCLYNFSYRKG